jgi:hypothetical protein
MPFSAVLGGAAAALGSYAVGSLLGGGGSPAPSPVASAVGGAITGASGTQQQAVTAADPFASQRAQYQPQLNQMMQGQFSPTDPSYAWRMQQGTDAVNRGMAGSGQLGSGNQMAQLQQQGQGLASTEYQNQYKRLAQLSGADVFGGSQASNLLQGQAGQQAAAGGQLVQGGMNAIGGALGGQAGTNIYNSLSGSSSNTLTPSSAMGMYAGNPTMGGSVMAQPTAAPLPSYTATPAASTQAASMGYGASPSYSNFSMGSYSDRRLKRNIIKIGDHILGIGLYSWVYVWGAIGYGVMADELEKVMPKAVSKDMNGWQMVNYSMIG